MCSIIGYKGKNSAAPILVDSLKKMEYRGYDSVGVATFDNGGIMVRKGTGKVLEVNKNLAISEMAGKIGIGHTRWATHGGVTDKNAHPHSACKNNIAVVHNGIIENYRELKEELVAAGHTFASETDSEVIAHLLEIHHDK
ncbi:MAG TPA: glutamine--fructose-6-phosphate transaminase (isomerizing), partial [Nitrososphaera sp.]|nr:glutamine--fructose-6-phosphate transaminase (isomerizing) [Nitrososphaera sp.]